MKNEWKKETLRRFLPMTKENRFLLICYIAGHFIVDFACAFFLYRTVNGTPQWQLSFLLYNFCAFALQMPFGLLADRLNHNYLIAGIGGLFVILAYGLGSMAHLLVKILPFAAFLPAAAAAGIGNGLFHVGGGIDLLNVSREKFFLLGVFVSPGALGIYLGKQLGIQNDFSILFILILLLAVTTVILRSGYEGKGTFRSSENVPVSFSGVKPGILIALVSLLAVVILRSYTGLVSVFPWNKQKIWGFALLSAVVLGKMAGGFLADRLGAVKASALSLLSAAVLYLLSGN
jgi:FSR family fosmidomycin resistance protein-like MFS transporter